MNYKRYNFNASLYNNKIIVVGGRNDDYASDIEIFENNFWSIVSKINFPREIFSMCVFKDKLLVLGKLAFF